MFEKKYKVKHYKSRIYNPIRGKIIRAALIIVIAGALFTAGWFAYEPLMKAINNANKEIIQNDPISKPEPEKKPEELPQEFLDKDTVAVTVPTEKLYDLSAYYSFLASLDKEVTAVVIDMKTAAGEVTYKSNQVSVQNVGAAAENAIDLASYIDTARRAGYDVIARIYAFEDSTAPYNSADMAIRYESEDGVLWLDDSVDNGGKPWLNPYSDTAQKYVLDIVYDAVDLGVDAILLDGVRFPEENAAMDYAYFGVGTEETGRGEILARFAKRVYSAVVTSGTDVLVAFDGHAVVTGDTAVYGGSPMDFDADGFAPCINLMDFVGGKVADGINFSELPADATELMRAVYEALALPEGAKTMPVLYCAGLTKGQVRSAARAAGNLGAVGYIMIYDEEFFTGVPQNSDEQSADGSESSSSAASQPQQPVKPPSSESSSSVPSYVPPSSSSSSSVAESSSSEEYSSIPGVTSGDYSGGGDDPVRWG